MRLFFLTSLCIIFGYYFFSVFANFERVAHAGGGINGMTYTNSLKAIEQSIENGFKIIEIDFSLTDDNKIICSHNIDDIKFNNNVLYEDFLIINAKIKYPACDLYSLTQLLYKNNGIKIITDVKYNNLNFLKYFYFNHYDLVDRLIPQVYSYNEYIEAKKIGYSNIILTLYRYKGYGDIESELLLMNDLYAITMSKKIFYSHFNDIKKIHPNTKIYVHTINNINDYCFMKKSGISEIYTDFLNSKYSQFYCILDFL